MNYYIYDKTGEIIKWGVAPIEEIILQAKEGEFAGEGYAHPLTHYVANDVLCTYSIKELAIKNNLQEGWIWQLPARIAVDTRLVVQVRLDATAAINAERDRRIDAFDRFTCDGVLYDANKEAQDNITNAAAVARLGATLPDGFTWRSFDNTDIPMTNAKLLALEAAMVEALGMFRFQMHYIARSLKSQIDQAKTSDDVLSIVWPA